MKYFDNKILVPGLFYDDHKERDLPTPVCHHCQGKGLWISKDDPALSEFLNDAEYYAHKDGPCAGDPSMRSLRTSAKTTAERIRAHLNPKKTP